MNYLRQIYQIALREGRIMVHNPVYFSCMVVFPLLVMFFFTSLMGDGQPERMPVAIVDNDNTSTTRALIRKFETFQNTKIVAQYPTVAQAREAIQENKIYGFMYFPKGTTEKLLASRQPKISYYYSMASVTGGTLIFKDMKTIATLGSAAVGQATMRAKGYTDKQIQTFLQPITIDLHQISNPWTNYNIYLTTMLVPGVMMLFIFLITAYSIGSELKFGKERRKWMEMADNNMIVALTGKYAIQTLIFLALTMAYAYYVFGVLKFPHPGGLPIILLLSVLEVLAAQGFGIFIFGIMPSLRMSMSICSLWGVLSFSMAGSAFPIIGMDTPLQSLSWLFPLRHYYMVYQICVFNGYPLLEAWFHLAALVGFALLPWLVIKKLKNAMLTYVYIP